MTFDTPKQFADYIRTYEYEPAPYPEDLGERMTAVKTKYADEIKRGEFDPEKVFSATSTMYQEVISKIVEHFYETLPKKVRKNFEQRFYFTTIDSRHVRANIRSYKDGRFFAVFVYSSLITAIHRLGKLEMAMFFPEMVEYCSRYPGAKVTRQQMIEIYAEVYAHFMETKIPLGPQILLHNKINFKHLFTLKIQEQLIVYHEIAHFLNGDLKKDPNQQMLVAPFPNLGYQREHMADIISFGMLLRQIKYEGKLTRELRYTILLAVINLYKIQHIIQGIETEEYPHPLNRMSVIIEKFYGIEVDDWVANAINGNMKTLTLKNMPTIKSTEEEEQVLIYVDQKLLKAFED